MKPHHESQTVGAKIEETVLSSKAKTSLINQDNNNVQKNNESNEPAKADGEEAKNEQKVGVITPKMKRHHETDAMPLLSIDEVFRKRWHIEGLIGKGGYGEIYLAIDMQRTEEVAIKAEPKTRRGKVARRMILEQKVLIKLQGKPHVPMVFASGHTDSLNFIVMQLLSINVGEIRKSSPVKRLSKSSTGRIMVQAIAALRDLHDCGYIHRDVKPANMCFGITAKNRHVLMLLDFGLIRRYKTKNGEFRPPRPRAGFRGTHRYVSTRVHARLEQSPSDDLVSLLYSAYELLIGELPWKSLEKNDEIKKLKEGMASPESDFMSQKEPLSEIAKLIFSLESTVDPPYSNLQELCKPLIGKKKLSDLYDWEEDYKEAVEENQSDQDKSV